MGDPSSLRCFLLLCLVTAEFVCSAASKLVDVHNYQVVIPRRIHTKHRRSSEGLHPSVVQFEVTVGGKQQVVYLEKNEQLIAKNYSETHYLKDGTEVTSNPVYPDHCYYHGYIKGEGGSLASFSTCEGFSGYLSTKGQRYVLEPLKGSDGDEHALYRYEEMRLPLKTCGVVNTSEDSSEPRVEETFSSPRECVWVQLCRVHFMSNFTLPSLGWLVLINIDISLSTGARVGPEICFKGNKQGNMYGYCRKTASGFQGCAKQDIMCGQLNCVGGNNQQSGFTYGSITFGRIVCRVVLDQDGKAGLVQNGAKCGASKMCVNSRCTDVPVVDSCSSRCPPRAVCNHLQQCQFEEGFSQIESGLPTYAIVIIVLVIILLIIVAIGVAACVHRKHTRKPTVTPRTQQQQTAGLSNPAFTDSAPATPRVMRPPMPKSQAAVIPPPPTYNTVPSAPFPPQQGRPLHPLKPSDKPRVPRAPPKPPGMKPPQPPNSKVLMPPTRPRN
ncbi:zinc metalloproteinase-disintegrin-like ecarin [Rhincodon typus]|uniref:zinc metalloproteinase-disintegrin-like ecarin n=1 Tax=Rhincodon typus TaxID=259920 RepID=UPI002030B327|nr:zinc metalloproteinase-disintegrin-like ecarin [Rhincodon typus]